MECIGSACCNGCFIEWVLVAPRPTIRSAAGPARDPGSRDLGHLRHQRTGLHRGGGTPAISERGGHHHRRKYWNDGVRRRFIIPDFDLPRAAVDPARQRRSGLPSAFEDPCCRQARPGGCRALAASASAGKAKGDDGIARAGAEQAALGRDRRRGAAGRGDGGAGVARAPASVRSAARAEAARDVCRAGRIVAGAGHGLFGGDRRDRAAARLPARGSSDAARGGSLRGGRSRPPGAGAAAAIFADARALQRRGRHVHRLGETGRAAARASGASASARSRA